MIAFMEFYCIFATIDTNNTRHKVALTKLLLSLCHQQIFIVK